MEIPRKMKCMIIQFVVLAVAFAAAGDAVASVEDAMRGPALDPLSMRWTFGNHEPIAMYRRVGGKADGTPEVALPLEGQIGEMRRYAIGKVKVE